MRLPPPPPLTRLLQSPTTLTLSPPLLTLPPSPPPPPTPQHFINLLISSTTEPAHRPFDEIPHRTHSSTTCKTIHARILKFGLRISGTLGNTLLDLYSKFGNLGYAQNTFNSLESPDATARNSILSAYSRCGHPKGVIATFASVLTPPDQFSFAMVLSACAKTVNIDYGLRAHASIIKTGFEMNPFCEGSLVDMYAKCDHIADARCVFDGIAFPDSIAWTNMIACYVRIGAFEEAMRLYLRMRDSGGVPDHVACVTVITACVGLGRLGDARAVFEQMHAPSVIAWNAIISGYSQNGREDEALGLYQKMRGVGVKPTRSTLGIVLSAAANLAVLDGGRQVHSDAVRLGLDSNVFVGSSLINMYAKCRNIDDARKVFDLLDERNTVIWNAMLGGYAQNSLPEKLIELFFTMKGLGFQIDGFTFVSVFSACASLENLQFGRQLHCTVIKNQYDCCLFVGNAIIDMYAKCEDINDSKRQFELVCNRDNISWNAIIVGLVHNEEQEEALNMFQRMRRGNVMADEVSFASVISACSSIRASEEGKQMHCLSIKYNLSSGLYVGSSLIDLYAKLEDMDAANLVYLRMSITGVVARNALIAGHIQKNDTEKAFNVFRQMQHEGLEPSCITFASILSACTRPSVGRQLHCHILKAGIPYHDEFVGVALLGMYMKSKLHEDANSLFSEMPESKSLVLWTSLISGHTQNGYSEDALLWFQKMRSSDIRPDQATFVSILKSCADLAALKDGTVIHSLVIETGFSSDEYSSSALVDMYSKCGDVRASLQIFHEMKNKADAISWNSMIVGFAKNGYAEEALLLFYQMQFSEATPDAITLLGVLTACSHAGLVSEGRGFFDSMRKKYGITPRVDHCACIVDLLGRGGYLKEAIEFIGKLPFEPDGVIWAPFLAACKIHGDWERGKHAAEKLIQLEPHNSSPYVLLSNIYAALGNWSEAKMVREAMRERGVRKLPGCSWIVVRKKTRLFVAGDKSHPNAGDINEILNDLMAMMKEDGYVAELDCLLLDEE